MSASITSGSFPLPRRAADQPLRKVARALWRFLCELGQARAVPHMLALARRYETSNPAFARELRERVQHGLL
jgi:hypothetical protein